MAVVREAIRLGRGPILYLNDKYSYIKAGKLSLFSGLKWEQ